MGWEDMGYNMENVDQEANWKRGSHWPADSGALRYKRNATDVVNFKQGQQQNTYGSYAFKLPNVHHQQGVLRRKDRRQLFQIHALLKEQDSRSYIGTADLMLPLVCDIHHMLRQKNLKEAYEDNEDSWRRRHEFLWRVEKYERQQEEEEKARTNRQKAETRKEQQRKTETEAVEEKTNDEVEEQIRTSEVEEQIDGEEEGNITLPNLLREPPGLEQNEDQQNDHSVAGQTFEGTQRRKGARLYGAVKRNLTPTPAKFRICSDSDTDNSFTLNSNASAPSHWWHESTSPSKRSQDQKRLNDNRLSRFKMGTPEQSEGDVLARQCSERSILGRSVVNAVISPKRGRIRPDSGLLEIQTEDDPHGHGSLWVFDSTLEHPIASE